MDLSEKLVISRPLYFQSDISECGYCHGEKEDTEANYPLTSIIESDVIPNNSSVGFQAEMMSVEYYDRLCNLGCRRSGNFVYKRDMLRNCCRLYTIRTNTKEVKIDKELKKSLKRFDKYINPVEDSATENGKGKGKGKKNEHYNFIEEILRMENDSISFKTVFEPPVFTKEKYDLFTKFQEKIHDDYKHSEKGFRRFLCDSPFSPEVVMGAEEDWDQLNNWKNLPDSEYIKRLGPVHECYYIDGKLIAFAVTDFLLTGLSSVYFVWDPDYAKLSLGKVSALRELAISSKIKDGYYYLGYYIGDCPKMNYKGKYGGELLDVCTRDYVPLQKLENITRKGRLFTMTNCEDKSETPQSEPFINENLSKLHLPSYIHNKLFNIADNIYGITGKAMAEANKAATSLSKLGIRYKLENMNGDPLFDNNQENENFSPESESDLLMENNSLRDIPNVVPGLMPLPELLQLVESGTIDSLKNNLLIYDTLLGGVRTFMGSDEESNTTMKIVCDTVRILGVRNTMNVIVII